MTPAELHSRILLHELRTILLDETREGPQIPYKELITKDPHNPASYLILSEELDDQLAELCRIQVELIEKLPPNYTLKPSARTNPNEWHPFLSDFKSVDRNEPFLGAPDITFQRLSLTKRRWETVAALYDEPYREEWRQMRSSRLGRTTRMLTDILRYCALNTQKVVCVVHNKTAETSARFLDLAEELTGQRPENPFTIPVVHDCQVCFIADRPPLAPNITFTDHACQHMGFDRASGRDFSATVDYDVLTCIGGPLHGEQQQLNRRSSHLQYPVFDPAPVTQYLADPIVLQESYQIGIYQRMRFAFPRRNPRPISNPSDTHTFPEYLVHEGLDEQEAIRLITELPRR